MQSIKFERIHIELTNQCNFSCSFCPYSLMSRAKKDIDFDVLHKALDEIAQEKLADTVYFHLMGEPLLYSHLRDAVRLAKDKGLKVSITTNGEAFTPDLLGPVLNAGVDEILFSIQTPDKKSFGLRKSAVKFDEYKKKICRAIAQALEHGGAKVILLFLTTPKASFFLSTNHHQIIMTKKELRSRVLEWVDVVLQDPRLSAIKNKTDLSRNLFIKRLHAFSLYASNILNLTENLIIETRVLGHWVHKGLTEAHVTEANIGTCEGLQTHFGILSNGDLVFCCLDYDGKTCFGNIKDTTLKAALEQTHVQAVLKGFKNFQIRHPYCKRCLGNVGFLNSLARQIGSIFYFKIYRPLWGRHQGKNHGTSKIEA
ncbi:MAG: radical SAM protein [Candidatus Omnitrophica bacterium]|nr:radical SAM protein [Candidatus Omnitrophota bacterium]